MATSQTDAERLLRAMRKANKLSREFLDDDNVCAMGIEDRSSLDEALDLGIGINCRLMRTLRSWIRIRRQPKRRMLGDKEASELFGGGG